MGNHILSADLNIQGGLLVGTMRFLPGLNILSGENGTFKTKVLQALKGGQRLLSDPKSPCRIQAVSPKRNAQRRAFQQVFDLFRRENKKLDGVINERNINDATFEEYPALGDLYYVVYDDLCKDGGNQIEKMQNTAVEFNTVIKRIFSQYELVAQWNSSTGSPTIELLKHGLTKVPLEGLSLGEQEILSLATNIYSSRKRYDVFLIDEPEVHLNWHLEERLFEFLDDYCNEYEKQMIVVTHSRAVFKERFNPKTQFLYWDGQGRVNWGTTVTDEQRRRIAGDAIEIIRLGDFTKPTFFVEDSTQVSVIQEIANALGVEITVTQCGTSANVRSLYRYSKLEPAWQNSYFVEDGDNEGTPFPGEENFIHLDKYCIENYLLDIDIAQGISQKSSDALRQLLIDSILDNRDTIFKKNRFFEFLVDHLKQEHLTPENLAKLDGAQVLPYFLKGIGMTFSDYIQAYIRECKSKGVIGGKMPKGIVTVIEDRRQPHRTGNDPVN